MDSNNTNHNFKEYNSCAESISSFLNLPPPPPPPPPPPTNSSSSSAFFDSFDVVDTFPQYLPSNLNHNSSSIITAPSSSAVQPPPPSRPSKKRSRASRRAPTTVLTTDTSNFRAMVQEFTGFPSPPFAAASSSSSFPRPRLDLSGAPNFLLRPFAQKVSFPSSIVDAIASTNANNTTTTCSTPIPTTTSSTSNSNLNYQFPPNLLHIQNPILAGQFGDLGHLIASEGTSLISSQGGGRLLPSWVDHGHESEGGDRNRQTAVGSSEYPPEKRSKSQVESWIHSSD